MTRIDFYFNIPNKFEVIRKLAVKASHAGSCTLLFTCDAGRARQIDQYLWSSPILTFLPHVSCKHPLAHKTLILIGDDPDCMATPDVLINLDNEVPNCFTRFDRMLEVVSETVEDREMSRQRYRHYKERGYPLIMHDMKVPT